jgi:hypothetical protein
MKFQFSIIPVLLLSAFSSATLLPAEIPTPDKLAPRETMFMLTVPDMDKMRNVYATSAYLQFFQDPAMKPFISKFQSKFKSDFLEPLEKEMGIKVADYQDLIKGQATLLIREWKLGKETNAFEFALALDSKSKKEELKTRLEELKTKWRQSGRELKPEKIHGTDFTTVFVSQKDLKNIFKKLSTSGSPTADGEKDIEESEPDKKTAITIGQVESLLLIGNQASYLEKIAIKVSGGIVPSLSELAVFEANYNQLFRDSEFWAWVNPKPFLDSFSKTGADQQSANDFMPSTAKIMEVLGLNRLASLSFSFKNLPQGSLGQFHASIPESQRIGLFKALTLEKSDSSPPPFVPADAVEFQRVRINLSKAWNQLESMITSISPQAAGAFKLIFESAGKDKDPNFDLRRELFGNLGNDVLSYKKNPRGTSLEELQNAPSIFLIGSADPEKLFNAIKVLTSSLGAQSEVKEREVAGKKIYTLPMPGARPDQGSGTHISTSAGYLAISADVAMIEEFLRSIETKPKPLRETPGLTEAAQEIGGMNLGLFGYSNPVEQTKFLFELVRKDPDFLTRSFSMNPLAPKGQKPPAFKEWVDFSLLPPFESVSKYFSIGVYGGSFESQGFTLKGFSPMPPQLKK